MNIAATRYRDINYLRNKKDLHGMSNDHYSQFQNLEIERQNNCVDMLDA